MAGLGSWTGNDNVPPSRNPPGGLSADQVPMFISLGFDDNPYGDGVSWVVTELSRLENPSGSGQASTFAGAPARATFYNTSTYAEAGASWKAAYPAGFEVGNHTVSHLDRATLTEAQWTTEIEGCIAFHTGSAVGQKREDIWGFRAPFLHYNAGCSRCSRGRASGTTAASRKATSRIRTAPTYLWPYTLDQGSPGNATNPRASVPKITTWPKGLWEMPAYLVIAPPDAEAARYGIPAGLRARLRTRLPYFASASRRGRSPAPITTSGPTSA